MIRSLYTAASGLVTGLRMQEIVAEGLSNVSTAGYKADREAATEFAGVLARRTGNVPAPVPLQSSRLIGRIGTGSYIEERRISLAAGAERVTEQSLDFMIRGDGFFVIDTAEGLRYTRDGRFARDAENRIVNLDGDAVLDVNGEPIVVDTDRVRVDAAGRMFREVEVEITLPDGTPGSEFQEVLVGTLGAVALDVDALVRAGDSQFTLAPGATATAVTLGQDASLVQGSLEEANVQVASIATRMVSLARIFEANQRVFSTLNDTLKTTVTDVGRVNG